MEKPAETATLSEEKHSINWGFVVWPLLILLLYALSEGPVTMVKYKGHISDGSRQSLEKFYKPLDWAYLKTPLHKPLGMYLHWWAPAWYDKNGDFDIVN